MGEEYYISFRCTDISDIGDFEVPGASTTLKRKKDILDLGR